MRVLPILMILGLIFSVMACGQQATEETTQATEPVVEPAPPELAEEALEPVEVTAEGTTFDPPVEVAQLPDGAWYCDMGTVHYARMDEGDGRCPTCDMDLVQKVAEVVPEETDEGDAEGPGV